MVFIENLSSHCQSAMALTGVRIILIFLGLNLIQTKHLLVETEDETGTDYKEVKKLVKVGCTTVVLQVDRSLAEV